MNADITGKFILIHHDKILFLSNRKMELSSGKLARFADGSAVVQVKKKKLKFILLQDFCI